MVKNRGTTAMLNRPVLSLGSDLSFCHYLDFPFDFFNNLFPAYYQQHQFLFCSNRHSCIHTNLCTWLPTRSSFTQSFSFRPLTSLIIFPLSLIASLHHASNRSSRWAWWDRPWFFMRIACLLIIIGVLAFTFYSHVLCQHVDQTRGNMWPVCTPYRLIMDTIPNQVLFVLSISAFFLLFSKVSIL